MYMHIYDVKQYLIKTVQTNRLYFVSISLLMKKSIYHYKYQNVKRASTITNIGM